MDETTKAAMESGRPLTIFHIREVHQLNPNATHITNNYYGDQFVPKDTLQKVLSEPQNENATCNLQLSLKITFSMHNFLPVQNMFVYLRTISG